MPPCLWPVARRNFSLPRYARGDGDGITRSGSLTGNACCAGCEIGHVPPEQAPPEHVEQAAAAEWW